MEANEELLGLSILNLNSLLTLTTTIEDELLLVVYEEMLGLMWLILISLLIKLEVYVELLCLYFCLLNVENLPYLN